MTPDLPLLLPALALVAFFYACVGHAGATGYIAVFALAGLGGNEIRPLALVLNILVASLATLQFVRAGQGHPRLVLVLALGSLPAALAGGALALPVAWLHRFLAVALLVPAWRLAWPASGAAAGAPTEAPPAYRLPSAPTITATGGLLGFMAGLSGTGGGIFLTPLLILGRWLPARQAAGVSAAFILVNSLAGLMGLLLSGRPLLLPPPASLLPIAAVVMLAGASGAWYGSRRLPSPWIRRLLALLMLLASVKLVNLSLG